jgi:hypothetical protein
MGRHPCRGYALGFLVCAWALVVTGEGERGHATLLHVTQSITPPAHALTNVSSHLDHPRTTDVSTPAPEAASNGKTLREKVQYALGGEPPPCEISAVLLSDFMNPTYQVNGLRAYQRLQA